MATPQAGMGIKILKRKDPAHLLWGAWNMRRCNIFLRHMFGKEGIVPRVVLFCIFSRALEGQTYRWHAEDRNLVPCICNVGHSCFRMNFS